MQSKFNGMGRALSLLLVLVMICSIIPVAVFATEKAGSEENAAQELNVFGVYSTSGVTYTASQVGGTSTVTNSTGVLVTFSEDVAGLTSDAITITGATKGAVSDNDDGDASTWLIGISNITVDNGDTITIEIASWADIQIDTPPQTVTVYKNVPFTHDLSTDGPLDIGYSETRDVHVTGSYSGSDIGITINGNYSGTITLDNVSIVSSGYSYGIDSLQSSSVTLNLIGTNSVKGYLGIYLPDSAVTLEGSGSLTVSEIRANHLTVDAPLTVVSDANGILAQKLVVNAPLKVTANGGDGITIYDGTSSFSAKPAYPLEINANVTVKSNGSGILAYEGIHLNSGNLSVTSVGGAYYERAHGIVWGDGAVNTQAPGTTVSSKAGVSSDGVQGFAYAAYRVEPAGKGSDIYIFARRSSFTDASTGGFADYDANEGTVLAQAPSSPPQTLVAVVPQDALPSGLSINDIMFRGDTLDGQTINAFADDIGASAYGDSGVDGKPIIRNFIQNMVDWVNNTVWMDLHLVDSYGNEIHGHSNEGITVYLPFPTGRDASTSDFLLIHKVNGLTIEVVNYELTPYGLKFKVYDFSPFALIYKDKKQYSAPSSSSSSDHTSSSSSSSKTTFTIEDPTQWVDAAAMEEFIKVAKNNPYVLTRNTGSYGIRKAAFAALAGLGYRHDTVSNNAVQVRIYIDDPSRVTKDLLVSGYVSDIHVKQTKAKFEKWFQNKLAVISLEQQGSYGMTVEIAAKVDLSKMDADNLYFYSYDKQSNRYKRFDTRYKIDGKDYIHFATELAGEIIISSGPLTKLAVQQEDESDTMGYVIPSQILEWDEAAGNEQNDIAEVQTAQPASPEIPANHSNEAADAAQPANPVVAELPVSRSNEAAQVQTADEAQSSILAEQAPVTESVKPVSTSSQNLNAVLESTKNSGSINGFLVVLVTVAILFFAMILWAIIPRKSDYYLSRESDGADKKF